MSEQFKDIRADDDTKKILAEMEKDGIKTDSLIPEDEKPPAPVEKKEEEKTEVEDDSATEETEADESTEQEEESEDIDEDEDDLDDEDDEEDSKTVSKKKYDKVIHTANRWKKKFKKLQEAKANSKESEELSDELEEELMEFAEANEIPEGTLKGMMKLFQKAVPKTETNPAITKLLQQQAEKDEEKRQNDLYSHEFNTNVAVLINRDAKLSADEVIMVKNKLKKLAFDPNNHQKSLVELYLENDLLPKKKKVSGENSNGGFATEEEKSLEEITDEDIANMDEKQFEQYSNALAKNSSYKITRKN